MACTLEHAVNIFQVLPIRNDFFNQCLSNHEMNIALRIHLHILVYKMEVKCPFCSKGILDVWGTHAIACSGRGDCNNRHNAIQNLLHDWVSALGFPANKEVGGLWDPLNPGKRLDNLFTNFINQKDTGVDVTFVDGCNSNVLASNFKAESPLISAHNRKDAKYKALCRNLNIDFLPFVVSHLGALGQSAIMLLKAIARAQAHKDDSTTTITMDRLRSAIAVSIAKRQAFAIQTRGDAQNVLFTNNPFSSSPPENENKYSFLPPLPLPPPHILSSVNASSPIVNIVV